MVVLIQFVIQYLKLLTAMNSDSPDSSSQESSLPSPTQQAPRTRLTLLADIPEINNLSKQNSQESPVIMFMRQLQEAKPTHLEKENRSLSHNRQTEGIEPFEKDRHYSRQADRENDKKNQGMLKNNERHQQFSNDSYFISTSPYPKQTKTHSKSNNNQVKMKQNYNQLAETAIRSTESTSKAQRDSKYKPESFRQDNIKPGIYFYNKKINLAEPPQVIQDLCDSIFKVECKSSLRWAEPSDDLLFSKFFKQRGHNKFRQ